jgi:hypothetical protein
MEAWLAGLEEGREIRGGTVQGTSPAGLSTFSTGGYAIPPLPTGAELNLLI